MVSAEQLALVGPTEQLATPVACRAALPHEIPAGARNLAARCDDSWVVRITYGADVSTYGGLSEETDGEGKRHRIVRQELTESIAVRLAHPETGVRAVATWARRPDCSWAADIAAVWRLHLSTLGEPVPRAFAYPALVKHADLAAMLAGDPWELVL